MLRANPLKPTRARVICFPHAGGSASFFRDWSNRLPGVEVYTVCYPRRGERVEEPGPDDLRSLGVDIPDAARPLADRPLALFGDSMGAAIAGELERRGVRLAHLVASGSRDADLPPLSPVEEDPDVVVERLVGLGGTGPDIAADPVFRELVLPYVVGDGRTFHAYVVVPRPLLQCPVTTIVGTEDDEAHRRPWSTLTSGAVRAVSVSSNHFYLIDNPPFELIATALDGSPATDAR